jgi:hypothetical protein
VKRSDFGDHIPYNEYFATFSQIRASVVFSTALLEASR